MNSLGEQKWSQIKREPWAVGPFHSAWTVPVGILDDAPVDPFLQDFKVRDAGCFSEVEAQLLSLAVPRVVEGSVMKKTQSRPTHTLSFIHRRRWGKTTLTQGWQYSSNEEHYIFDLLSFISLIFKKSYFLNQSILGLKKIAKAWQGRVFSRFVV